MSEPEWRKLKLSLERPYTSDDGQPLPVLHDITPDGQLIREPKEDPTESLGKDLTRLFVERGLDFFDQRDASSPPEPISDVPSDNHPDAASQADQKHDAPDSIMTTEELFEMRKNILPQLHIAFGEMSHARDLLTLLTSPSQPSAASKDTPQMLSATIVSKPPPISSVQAFNAQLSIAGKDEALRKAAKSFKAAAESTERGRVIGEKYWVDALKIRRENWGLIPAPLPPGSSTGKGADKSSKDFLISFGLEESPPVFRKRAIGHMATYDTKSDAIVFPQRQRTRLAISIRNVNATGEVTFSRNWIKTVDTSSLEGSLKAAQQEVVEQEIFSVLVKEAGSLPTASARVSERLVVIDAAQGMELCFELIDSDDINVMSQHTSSCAGVCDLIHSILHALLLRMHSQLKRLRLGKAGIVRNPFSAKTLSLVMLEPIIDVLQYQVFCERVKHEVDKMTSALCAAGISAVLRFDPVGEVGQDLVGFLEGETKTQISGEAVLRIDDSYTLRLTFLSPSSLTAHLPQANLAISSIPQLCQLLSDEVEQCLLGKICELGSHLEDNVSRTWFVDLVKSRSVGRWEGCVINFRISFEKDYSIHCAASCLDRENNLQQFPLERYTSQSGMSLMTWAEEIIRRASGEP